VLQEYFEVRVNDECSPAAFWVRHLPLQNERFAASFVEPLKICQISNQ
jgi:hypothetical protein